MFVRLTIALFLALGVGFGLFYVMNGMITNSQPALGSGTDLNLTGFIQLEQQPDQLRTKDRQKPEPPPPPDKPPPPKLTVSKEITTQQQPQLNMPKIEMSMGVGGGPMLGGVGGGAGVGAFGGDLIPLVRIEPQYPREAARGKIEGYVKVAFTVLEDGSVTDIEVVDAEPRRIFNRAAVRAISKWKFKPRIVDGKPVKRRATQTLKFTLPDANK